MKKNYLKRGTFALLVFMLLGFNSQSFAQIRYVDVDPGVGTLNEAINGDTTATGARVDTFNTVYRLKRVDDIYYISALISNIDYPLTVVAEEGDGPRPYLALKADGTGSTAEYCFRPKGDLTVKGLHMTLMDDLGAVSSRVIRASADDIRITIDNCWLDEAEVGIRLDDENNKVYITNSVFSNLGDPSKPSAGRGIDDRGNSIDTLIIEDCTFYNITHSMIRDGGGYIKHCVINNNNFVNVGRRGFGFGDIAELDFTNNILHNVGFVPQDTGSSMAVFEMSPISQELLDLGYTQSINITNNSIFLDTTVFKDYLNDGTIATPLFDPSGQAIVDANPVGDFYYENVNFENPPDEESIMKQVEYQLNENLNEEDTPDWILPDPPNSTFHLDVPFSFNYANSVAMTGSTDGTMIGDRNWTASPLSIEDAKAKQYSEAMSVYPLPAQTNVNVEFTLKSKSQVQINVYNLSGKRVGTIINEMYPAGMHQVNWNFNNEINSGIYLLRMNADGKLSASKMIVK